MRVSLAQPLTWLGLSLTLGLRLPGHVVGVDRLDGGRQLLLRGGQVQVVGEDEVTEVHGEPPAPD